MLLTCSEGLPYNIHRMCVFISLSLSFQAIGDFALLFQTSGEKSQSRPNADMHVCCFTIIILEKNSAIGLSLDMVGLHPQLRLGGVRVKVEEAAAADLRHSGLGEPHLR